MDEIRLPDLIIGGAPRSGTTLLVHALSSHPDIFVPRPFRPEPKVCLVPGRSVRAYREHYARLFMTAPRGVRLVEKTTNYFENAEAATRVKAVTPDSHLLFILREPVARAYSNYLWSRSNGLETLSFAEAVAADGERPDPLAATRPYARPFDYIRRGYYDVLAEPWLATFGGAVHFVFYEDIRIRPRQLFNDIQSFLRVIPKDLSSVAADLINATGSDLRDVDPALVTDLRARFRPHVQRLAASLDLAEPPWGYA